MQELLLAFVEGPDGIWDVLCKCFFDVYFIKTTNLGLRQIISFPASISAIERLQRAFDRGVVVTFSDT